MMSTTQDDSSLVKKTGPIHVLMASSTASTSPLLDERLQNDYVYKRSKKYRKSSTKKFKGTLSTVWDGVSRIEKELICCCEGPPPVVDDEYHEQGGGRDFSFDGALDVRKEIQFAGILARDCHTMASKCLALAILERTLHAYLKDEQEEEEEEEEEDDQESSEDDEEPNNVPSKDEGDAEWTPGSKRPRPNAEDQNEENTKKQKLLVEEKEINDPQDGQDDQEDDENEEEDEEVGRLERFLTAGGLKVLNRWLIDASTEEPIITLKNPPGSTKPPEVKKPKPPATRPLILPILRFLEHIPFDKKVVTDSKINKQIRNLGKQVKAIRQARDENRHKPIDMQNWSVEMTGSTEKHAIDQVAEAVDNVKKSWERMAKEDPRKFDDPFESLKTTLKERLGILLEFELGKIPKPDWLAEPEPEPKKKSKVKKLNTKELAAKERQAERDSWMKGLKEAEQINRARLEKIREALRKRKEASSAPKTVAPLDKGTDKKSVVWKDGMKTQTSRNRKLLEEVFIFVKNTPASREAALSPTNMALDEDDS